MSLNKSIHDTTEIIRNTEALKRHRNSRMSRLERLKKLKEQIEEDKKVKQ
jgi:hypothetical protein